MIVFYIAIDIGVLFLCVLVFINMFWMLCLLLMSKCTYQDLDQSGFPNGNGLLLVSTLVHRVLTVELYGAISFI